MPDPTEKPTAPAKPPVPDRLYFEAQIKRLELNEEAAVKALADASRALSEIRGGLTLARGQLNHFFPSQP